jgi:polyphosphate kinase
VDRFLEHARIMCFHHGGEQKVFISSADWMTRNLDSRIELLVPVDDAACSVRLIEILDTCFRDTASAWRLGADGAYERVQHDARKKPLRAQQALYRRACEQARQGRRAQRTIFVPHRPPAAERE